MRAAKQRGNLLQRDSPSPGLVSCKRLLVASLCVLLVGITLAGFAVPKAFAAAPGGVVEQNVTVSPGSVQTLHYDCWANPNNGVAITVKADATGPLAGWVAPSHISCGSMSPGGDYTVSYTLTVPTNQSPGQYQLTWSGSCAPTNGNGNCNYVGAETVTVLVSGQAASGGSGIIGLVPQGSCNVGPTGYPSYVCSPGTFDIRFNNYPYASSPLTSLCNDQLTQMTWAWGDGSQPSVENYATPPTGFYQGSPNHAYLKDGTYVVNAADNCGETGSITLTIGQPSGSSGTSGTTTQQTTNSSPGGQQNTSPTGSSSTPTSSPPTAPATTSLLPLATASAVTLGMAGAALGATSLRSGGNTQDFRRRWDENLPRVSPGMTVQLPQPPGAANQSALNAPPCGRLKGQLDGLKGAIDSSAESIRDQLKEIKAAADEAQTAIGDAVIEEIPAVLQALGSTMSILGECGGQALEYLDALKPVEEEALGLTGKIDAAIDNLMESGAKLTSEMVEHIGDATERVGDTLSGPPKPAWAEVGEAGHTLSKAVKERNRVKGLLDKQQETLSQLKGLLKAYQQTYAEFLDCTNSHAASKSFEYDYYVPKP